jgi:hypothetical protein
MASRDSQKAERDEVRNVTLKSAEHPSAFIAGCRAVGRQAGFKEIFEIRVGDARVCFTVPDPGDHDISLVGSRTSKKITSLLLRQ